MSENKMIVYNIIEFVDYHTSLLQNCKSLFSHETLDGTGNHIIYYTAQADWLLLIMHPMSLLAQHLNNLLGMLCETSQITYAISLCSWQWRNSYPLLWQCSSGTGRKDNDLCLLQAYHWGL